MGCVIYTLLGSGCLEDKIILLYRHILSGWAKGKHSFDQYLNRNPGWGRNFLRTRDPPEEPKNKGMQECTPVGCGLDAILPSLALRDGSDREVVLLVYKQRLC